MKSFIFSLGVAGSLGIIGMYKIPAQAGLMSRHSWDPESSSKHDLALNPGHLLYHQNQSLPSAVELTHASSSLFHLHPLFKCFHMVTRTLLLQGNPKPCSLRSHLSGLGLLSTTPCEKLTFAVQDARLEIHYSHSSEPGSLFSIL